MTLSAAEIANQHKDNSMNMIASDRIDYSQLAADGAVFYVSHSGGKDSQAMYAYLCWTLKIPAEQIVVVHADLGEIEHAGVQDHIRENLVHELNVVRAQWKDGSEKTLLGMVEKRFADRPESPSWPSSAARFCTSDLKRDPIAKFMRNDLKARGATVGVNCMGLRAQESSARAKKPEWEVNKRESLDSGARTIYNWNPLIDWTEEDVFRCILDAGQKPHPAYGEIVDYKATGNDRLSCVFCIMGSRNDIARGAEQRPDLLEVYAELEERTGWTVFKGETIRERAGIHERVEEEYVAETDDQEVAQHEESNMNNTQQNQEAPVALVDTLLNTQSVYDRLNLIYDYHQQECERFGQGFHNALWQIMVEGAVEGAFYRPHFGEGVVVALEDGGFVPCGFDFADSVPEDDRDEILQALNMEVFQCLPDRAMEIIARSMS